MIVCLCCKLTFQATPFGRSDCTTVPPSFPEETRNPNPYPGSFSKVMHFYNDQEDINNSDYSVVCHSIIIVEST